jgi:DNA-binding NarL/FixJ family response regulator
MEEITNIVIVEDNQIIKEGYTLILSSFAEYHVVASYTNCEDALKNLEKDKPHIILMDLELPGMHGIQGITKIKKSRPETEIIVVSIHENSEMVFEALCAGACGYITKNSNYSRLLDAIKEVKAGGAPMSSNIARMVVASFRKNHNSPLTERETEVLELLARGKSYSIIADELFIHKETVKTHLKNIYSKLHVKSKAAAIEVALQNKLI